MTNVVQLPEVKSERGGFFAVDRRIWPRVVSLGLNPSVAYLVLARGSGGDNRTTSWSTNAIENYTGIGRVRALEAIGALIKAELVTRLRGGSRPQYYIKADDSPDPGWIWLPNALIDGAAGERPPVERIRQSHNLGALRLLIEMYGAHDLVGEGGIPWRVPVGIRQDFARTRLGEWGQYVIWGFARGNKATWRTSSLVHPHLGPKGTPEETIQPFWAALDVLERAGLLQFIPHLVDADGQDGEVIHSLANPLEASLAEAAILMAAQRAGMDMLPESRHGQIKGGEIDLVVPVETMLSAVQVIGIGRLRYRPKTSATAAWLEGADDWERWADQYRALHVKVSGRSDMQHQGEIKA